MSGRVWQKKQFGNSKEMQFMSIAHNKKPRVEDFVIRTGHGGSGQTVAGKPFKYGKACECPGSPTPRPEPEGISMEIANRRLAAANFKKNAFLLQTITQLSHLGQRVNTSPSRGMLAS